jgi:hypothetical protein
VEVGAEEANPEECRFLGDGRQGLFNDVRGLIFALYKSLAMVFSRPIHLLRSHLHPCEVQSYPFQRASRRQGGCVGQDALEKVYLWPQ